MNKHFVHKIKKSGERAIAYVIAIAKLLLIAILGFFAIDLIMLIGKDFAVFEYNILAITAYFSMNVFLILLLSKDIIGVISLLKPRVY